MNLPRLVSKLISGNFGKSVLVFLIKGGAGVAGFLLFAIIARICGPQEFGKFAVLFSAAMLTGLVGSLGQQVFLVKEISVANHARDDRLEMIIYSYSFTITLIGAFITSALFIAIANVFFPQYAGFAAVGGAMLSAVYALSQTTLGALRIQERIVFALTTRDLLWRTAAIMAIAAASWASSGLQVTAGTILLFMAVILLVIVAWHCILILKFLKGRTFSLKGCLSTGWGKLTAGLTLVAVISSADLYAFSVVLGAVVPASEVGPFFAAMRAVEAINLFLMSTAWVIGPQIARAVATSDSKLIQSECNKAMLVQCAPTIMVCVALMFAAPYVLGIFHPSFPPYSGVLRILAIGTLVNALTGATTLMLQLIGLHWRQVAYQGGSLLVALLLLPLLTSEFGLVGAAWSYVLSKILWNLLAVISIRRKIGTDPTILGLFGTGAIPFLESLGQLKAMLQRH